MTTLPDAIDFDLMDMSEETLLLIHGGSSVAAPPPPPPPTESQQAADAAQHSAGRTSIEIYDNPTVSHSTNAFIPAGSHQSVNQYTADNPKETFTFIYNFVSLVTSGLKRLR